MEHISASDAMRLALILGEKGRLLAPPNPWVGCVVIKNGVLVGEGYTQLVGEPHAEVRALHMAGNEAAGAFVYVTLEPCAHHGRTPPCVDALIKAKVGKVFVGIEDPDDRVKGCGIEKLKKAGIPVEVGLLAELIRCSLAPYLHQRITRRPFCVLKAAVSIDGRIAAEDGSSQWLTSPEARADVHRLRAESQAIMVGVNTAIVDQPRLNVRETSPLPPQQPLRVVLDGHGKLLAKGPLFDSKLAPTLIMTTSLTQQDAIAAWKSAGAEVEILPMEKNKTRIDLQKALEALGTRGILQLFVEGGAGLFSAFLKDNLFQRLHLYIGPRILGKTGIPLFGDWQIPSLSHAPCLEYEQTLTLGNTIRITYKHAHQENAASST